MVPKLSRPRPHTAKSSVAVAFSDGSITLWDLAQLPKIPATEKATKEALRQQCLGTPVLLSRAEWKRLIPELPYAPACIEVMKRQAEGEHE
ncbi:hypothetical protein ACFRKB_20835 [Streptomyces scopuliridis]|uniref:hypothetical protein n=1 Tax=Streptomyces scopuliridis TaxID=452529 RepID=UPI0036A3136E